MSNAAAAPTDTLAVYTARGTAAADEAHVHGWPADEAAGPWPYKSAESQAWRAAYRARREALAAAQVTK
jgi:hypothetical protein